MAAHKDNPRQESMAETISYEFRLQDFGDEPVNGARAAANNKKPAQSSGERGCKPLDVLDELRMLN
jgi:hypothetical protein